VTDPMTVNGRTGVQVVQENTPQATPAATRVAMPVLATDQDFSGLSRAAGLGEQKPQVREIPLIPVPTPVKRESKPPPPSKPAKLIVEPTEKGSVRVRLEDVSDDDLAFIIFEAFTQLDYRLGSPVIITKAPWEAELPISKRGHVKVSATLTRLGGNPDKPLTTTVEVGRK
jgi:hypothetical protein